jgi:hypothetical protein
MPKPTPDPDVPARDRLMTRPDEEPLPAAQDPKDPAAPADPRPVPKKGQGTDPKAGARPHPACARHLSAPRPARWRLAPPPLRARL